MRRGGGAPPCGAEGIASLVAEETVEEAEHVQAEEEQEEEEPVAVAESTKVKRERQSRSQFRARRVWECE